MSIKWDNLIKRAQAKTHWTFANDQLYQLCARRPLHDEIDVIIGKVWLIGRSYAAAIERKRMNASPGDGFYEQIVGPTIKNSDIDRWISAATTPPSSAPGSMELVLTTHYKLMRLFNAISGADKRSLASKYLHFHRPQCFYILDSRAVAGMRLLADAIGKTRAIKYEDVDAEYSRFVQRCTHLRSRIKQHCGALLLPREIDNLLLAVFSLGESPGAITRRSR